jgi:hypothetical protein
VRQKQKSQHPFLKFHRTAPGIMERWPSGRHYGPRTFTSAWNLLKSLIQFTLSLRDAERRTRDAERIPGPLAQSAEHLTLNQGVVGSIPTRPIFNKPAGHKDLLAFLFSQNEYGRSWVRLGCAVGALINYGFVS